MKQVGVHLLQSNATFDIEYTYLVDDTLVENGEISRGSFVDVPFGARKQLQTAVVWTLDKKIEDTDKKIKFKKIANVSNIRTPLTESEMLLAEKMSSLYFCPISACVKCMIPPDAPKGRQVNYAVLNIKPEESETLCASGQLKNIVHIRILENLRAGKRRVSDLAKEIGCTAAVINTLAKRGYVKIEKDYCEQEDFVCDNKNGTYLPTYNKHTLNTEQQNAYDFLWKLIEKQEFSECLLHGVTGSGKTEIYMQLISETIKNKGSALLLVPEISLTPQMTAHFKNRFGDNVAILHSRLSDKERNHHWNRIKNSEVSIAIGARSAVFAPFENLRLIILDEEHETSYRSEDSAPRYHAAEVAEEIAKIKGATVIYGSATPRIETYYRALMGEIHHISLKNRANKTPLPQVEVIDMREERVAGNIDRSGIFSNQLKEQMEKNYKNGKQTMLFVHRRGYAKQMLCQSCGKTLKCVRCNMPMTYHEKGNRLICHHCGRTFLSPEACPSCGSAIFEKRGLGTQKVTEELAKLFPDANIIRMDTDTTSVKDGHEKLLSEFASGKAQFLVGTQMIAKGHDFPQVTLVGILSADSLINMPDYKAQERAFQLFTQMAGRAGRGNSVGKVIMQAYNVDDYAITAASNHNYEEFYRNEIVVRETLSYPPFSSMCIIRFAGEDDRETYSIANAFCGKMKELGEERVEILGPARADVPKVNNKYRWIITIKGDSKDVLTKFLRKFTENGRKFENCGKVAVSINFHGR